MLFANTYYTAVVTPTSKMSSQKGNLKGLKQEQGRSPHTGREFQTNSCPLGLVPATVTCFKLKMLVLNLDLIMSWQRLHRSSIPMFSSHT